jgi:ATP-dependent DNA ligase
VQGKPSFQALQHRASTRLVVAYYVFDVLDVNGESLMQHPLDDRRRHLAALNLVSPVLLSESLPGSPAQIVRAIKKLKLEGVVAKRRDSIYRPGKRTDDWIKVRFGHRQEFVVGGYRPNGHSFDALIVGYYDQRTLRFAAKVRAGFTAAIRRQLVESLWRLNVDQCPFDDLPMTKHARWGNISPRKIWPTCNGRSRRSSLKCHLWNGHTPACSDIRRSSRFAMTSWRVTFVATRCLRRSFR